MVGGGCGGVDDSCARVVGVRGVVASAGGVVKSSSRHSTSVEDAAAFWRVVGMFRGEAEELRKRADDLDATAARLDRLAAAIADGRLFDE